MNLSNTRVSVVIPNFNRAHLILETLQSVVDQTVKVHEIIVLDDCSSDNSIDRIENFSKTSPVTIKLHKSPRNVGPSRLRNMGAELAAGDFIAFLDSDDVWTPHKIETFYSDLQKYKMKFWTHRFGLKGVEEIISDKVQIISPFLQLLKNFAPTPCTIVHKDCFLGFNNSMKHNEDHELFTRIAFREKLFKNQSALTLLNRPPNQAGGLSQDTWKMRRGEIKTYWNLSLEMKWLLPFFPFLLIFSILKFFRRQVLVFFCIKNNM